MGVVKEYVSRCARVCLILCECVYVSVFYFLVCLLLSVVFNMSLPFNHDATLRIAVLCIGECFYCLIQYNTIRL